MSYSDATVGAWSEETSSSIIDEKYGSFL